MEDYEKLIPSIHVVCHCADSHKGTESFMIHRYSDAHLALAIHFVDLVDKLSQGASYLEFEQLVASSTFFNSFNSECVKKLYATFKDELVFANAIGATMFLKSMEDSACVKGIVESMLDSSSDTFGKDPVIVSREELLVACSSKSAFSISGITHYVPGWDGDPDDNVNVTTVLAPYFNPVSCNGIAIFKDPLSKEMYRSVLSGIFDYEITDYSVLHRVVSVLAEQNSLDVEGTFATVVYNLIRDIRFNGFESGESFNRLIKRVTRRLIVC